MPRRILNWNGAAEDEDVVIVQRVQNEDHQRLREWSETTIGAKASVDYGSKGGVDYGSKGGVDYGSNGSVDYGSKGGVDYGSKNGKGGAVMSGAKAGLLGPPIYARFFPIICRTGGSGVIWASGFCI
ncbi:uncharacterized protein FFE2_12672 [Fusarium fujikuroi]|uniref:Uncharacterized protein n=1 Tax=Fusarium fujikuroi TaxID=5127 RepID=A0A9Q9UDY5_FUSFU|nr:uncharacterized protein FFE2_12672 [Fusarium fujikuroi]SCV57352.1 uncharacterized protein FFFS_12681 [Fusarium fujikuroi]VTT77996.1 unnamed protein product [Fusarium fujikuroi]